MNKEEYIKLKEDLVEAVKNKDNKKIEEIKTILNITKEQEMYFEKGLTGYPSVDKLWLKYYKEGAEDLANNIPINKTLWDVIEEKLLEYYDVPALEYFGKIFSKQEFIDSCYLWARTFRAMGVEENEIVPIYGPVVPDICAMVFGLNMIGASAYFLKLAISKEALEEETRDSKIAVVYDGMWKNVREEFSKDKFKKVIVASVTADMPSPKKEIVSFLNKMQSKKDKSQIPNEKKYIWIDKAREISEYYTGKVKVPFIENRPVLITSSSGTTINGVVKGTVATNESVISQILSGTYSEIPYFVGDRVLNHFPFTASTSLNSLYLLPLYNGLTVVIDPRVSEKDFYNQIINLKPNIALTTGSAWESFFNRVKKEMESGKKFDFSYAKGWTVGGEGTDCNKFENWNQIMKQAGATSSLFSGYGLSETFSAVSVENSKHKYKFTKPIMSVGLPQAGMIVGVFDKNGNELTYNQRGELYVKTNAHMKEYYKKPELTKTTLIDDWIHTGDLAEIDDEGSLYIWGRINDGIDLPSGEKLRLFDIANKIKEYDVIDDAMVLPMLTNEENTLVVHIVWNKNVEENNKALYLNNINSSLKSYLPNGIKIIGYAFHEGMLPYSSTTLKKDKNKLSKQTDGYFCLEDQKLIPIKFESKNGKYEIIYENIDENVKKLIKK